MLVIMLLCFVILREFYVRFGTAIHVLSLQMHAEVRIPANQGIAGHVATTGKQLVHYVNTVHIWVHYDYSMFQYVYIMVI